MGALPLLAAEEMNRKRIAILLSVLLLQVFLVSLYCYQPPMPDEWHRLHRGMTIDEVRRHIPDLVVGKVYYAKREFRILGLRPCRWQAVVLFDSEGLSRAYAVFVDLTYGSIRTEVSIVDWEKAANQ